MLVCILLLALQASLPGMPFPHVRRLLHHRQPPPPCPIPVQVLLVTDKPKVAPMVKSLSQRFADKNVKFGQYTLSGEAAEKVALAALGVTKTPALLALRGTDASKAVVYEGA